MRGQWERERGRGAYGRGLDDGNGLDNLLLVRLGARTLKLADGGRHTSLVTKCGSEVDGLLGVILGEGLKRERRKDIVRFLNQIMASDRGLRTFAFPLCLEALLRGRNASEPCRGAS